MKKILATILAATALFAGTNAYAQFSAGIGWLNSTETSRYTNKTDVDRFALNGLYLGGQYNLSIVENFGVAPGLYMSALFGQDAVTSKGLTVRADYREIALNLPVNLNYAFELGSVVKLIIYAGPVFHLGLTSRSAFEVRSDVPFLPQLTTGRYTFNNFTGQLKDSKGNLYEAGDAALRNRFNMFLGGGLGVQIGDFQIMFGYDHSMLNFSKDPNEKASRSQFKLGIGLSF